MTPRHLAATVLSAAALLSAAACAGRSAPSAAGATTTAPAATTSTTTAATPLGTAAQGTTIAPPPGSGAAGGAAAPCANGDLTAGWGHGSVGGPHQGSPVVFTNVSHHACTLRGYPGAAIVDGATVINATRVLNGYMGDRRIGLDHLGSAPLVTLAPGAIASAMLEWELSAGQACYSTTSGTFEVTAPGTTDTTALSHGATVGGQGIYSCLEINPVVSGTIG
jgi:hypothetical protein